MSEGRVVAEPGVEGLGAMLADLVRANLERDPRREAFLGHPAAAVNVRARDAGAAVGLIVGGGQFRVLPRPVARADLAIDATAEVLMSLTTVPLRFGLPDTLTPEGRAVMRAMRTGDLKVRGMLANLTTLSRLNRLLSSR